MKLIARGGYSKIYLYKDDSIIKVPKENIFGIDRHILREYMCLLKLDHPNIIKIKSTIIYKKRLCYMTDRLYPIASIITSDSYKNNIFYEFLSDSLQAIYCCHNNQIIHMDIHINNFVCDTTDTNRYVFKLIDFGLSCIYYETDEYTNPSYLHWHLLPIDILFAIDNNNKAYISPIIDIWAYGLMLVYILTGQHMFLNMKYDQKTLEIPYIISQIFKIIGLPNKDNCNNETYEYFCNFPKYKYYISKYSDSNHQQLGIKNYIRKYNPDCPNDIIDFIKNIFSYNNFTIDNISEILLQKLGNKISNISLYPIKKISYKQKNLSYEKIDYINEMFNYCKKYIINLFCQLEDSICITKIALFYQIFNRYITTSSQISENEKINYSIKKICNIIILIVYKLEYSINLEYIFDKKYMKNRYKIEHYIVKTLDYIIYTKTSYDYLLEDEDYIDDDYFEIFLIYIINSYSFGYFTPDKLAKLAIRITLIYTDRNEEKYKLLFVNKSAVKLTNKIFKQKQINYEKLISYINK